MNIADVAKKIREAVMDRAENDGRVFHADAIEAEVAKILTAEFPTTNVWGYRVAMADAGLCVMVDPPDYAVVVDPTEWR